MTNPNGILPATIFHIEPYSQYAKPGQVDLQAIATRVYGKPFDPVRSCQVDFDEARNGDRILIGLSDDSRYERRLSDFDGPEVELGYDYPARDFVYHRGHTPLDYWLSISRPGLNGKTEADVTVEPNPPEGADLYGAVFPEESFAQRRSSPSLSAVLADLIRRGELPRGDYLFHHWW